MRGAPRVTLWLDMCRREAQDGIRSMTQLFFSVTL
jgi:hypothetical protein